MNTTQDDSSPRDGIVRSLFPDDILVGEMDPGQASPTVLLPAEAARVERAVPKRRHEFAAGRLLARRLFERLDVAEGFALLNGEDRAPIWPEGVVGTISHTRGWAAVAATRTHDALGLGCDLELDEPLKDGLLRRVCGPGEREWIASAPGDQRGRLAMLMFSAKEAAYKAQYPLTGSFLAFSDLSVEFDLAGGTFRARFEKGFGPCRRGQVLHGRWRRAGGLIATAVTIRRQDLADGSIAAAQ